MTRVSRNVAAHAEALVAQTRRSDGDLPERKSLPGARMALGGGSDDDDDETRLVERRASGPERTARSSLRSETAASLMSPASERFMRDDA